MKITFFNKPKKSLALQRKIFFRVYVAPSLLKFLELEHNLSSEEKNAILNGKISSFKELKRKREEKYMTSYAQCNDAVENYKVRR